MLVSGDATEDVELRPVQSTAIAEGVLPQSTRPSISASKLLQVPTELRIRLVESDLFSIGAFRRQHTARVRYHGQPEDDALLEAAGMLDVGPQNRSNVQNAEVLACLSADAELLPPGSAPQAVAAPHPLLSVRRADDGMVIRRSDLVYRNVAPIASASTRPVVSTSSALVPCAQSAGALGLSEDMSGAGEFIASDSVLVRVAVVDHGEWRREFVLHGEQTLLELRSLISCATAEQLVWQQGTIRKAEHNRRGGELPPKYQVSDSACFCIEGNFFVCGEVDLSVKTREWMESRMGGGLTKCCEVGLAHAQLQHVKTLPEACM